MSDRERQPDITEELSDLREWLQPLPGPTEIGSASGRRLLLSRLHAHEPAEHGLWRGMLLKPAAMLGGALLLGAFALGGAAAAGVPVQSPVQDVLQGVGLQKAGNSDVTPPGLNKGARPESGGAGDRPGSVSDAVNDAIQGSEPGPGRGDAVRDAACGAAQDRSTLPAPAQAHGTPEAKDDHACGSGAPTNTGNVAGTVTPAAKPGNGPQPTRTPRGQGAGNASENAPRGPERTPGPPSPTPTPGP